MKAPSDAPMRFHQFFARARFSKRKVPKKNARTFRGSRRETTPSASRAQTRAHDARIRHRTHFPVYDMTSGTSTSGRFFANSQTERHTKSAHHASYFFSQRKHSTIGRSVGSRGLVTLRDARRREARESPPPPARGGPTRAMVTPTKSKSSCVNQVRLTSFTCRGVSNPEKRTKLRAFVALFRARASRPHPLTFRGRVVRFRRWSSSRSAGRLGARRCFRRRRRCTPSARRTVSISMACVFSAWWTPNAPR
jgi:hypothetical protein